MLCLLYEMENPKCVFCLCMHLKYVVSVTCMLCLLCGMRIFKCVLCLRMHLKGVVFVQCMLCWLYEMRILKWVLCLCMHLEMYHFRMHVVFTVWDEIFQMRTLFVHAFEMPQHLYTGGWKLESSLTSATGAGSRESSLLHVGLSRQLEAVKPASAWGLTVKLSGHGQECWVQLSHTSGPAGGSKWPPKFALGTDLRSVQSNFVVESEYEFQKIQIHHMQVQLLAGAGQPESSLLQSSFSSELASGSQAYSSFSVQSQALAWLRVKL